MRGKVRGFVRRWTANVGCERVCYDRVCHAMECVAVVLSSYLGVPVTVIDNDHVSRRQGDAHPP